MLLGHAARRPRGSGGKASRESLGPGPSDVATNGVSGVGDLCSERHRYRVLRRPQLTWLATHQVLPAGSFTPARRSGSPSLCSGSATRRPPASTCPPVRRIYVGHVDRASPSPASRRSPASCPAAPRHRGWPCTPRQPCYRRTDAAFLARQTLSLTKTNWNNTQFDSRYPIKIRPARGVGDTLRYVEEGRGSRDTVTTCNRHPLRRLRPTPSSWHFRTRMSAVPHIHRREGEITFYVGDETCEATPGTFVYAPRGPHPMAGTVATVLG